MQRHSDEALVAYLDGELDADERRHVEAWLEADPAVRERLMALVQSGDLVRGAYADIVDEPVPPRLIAAARGVPEPMPGAAQNAEILVLKRPGWAAIPLPARPFQDEDFRFMLWCCLATRRRDQPLGHGLVDDIAVGAAQQVGRLRETGQPVARRVINGEPGLDMLPFRAIEFAV